MNRFKFCILIVLFFYFNSKAQKNTVTIGGNATGIGGSVSYSIGQIDYMMISNSNGSINQGVQQPVIATPTFSKIATQKVSKDDNEQAFIYPNPSNKVIFVNMPFYNPNNSVILILSNDEGKLLSKQSICSAKTEINISQLPTSTYFVQIINQNKKMQSIKLIKTDK